MQVAKHLCHAYGAAAFAVCELAKPTNRSPSKLGVPTDGGAHTGRLLVPDYPYLEAEVTYACKHEMALTVKVRDLPAVFPPSPLLSADRECDPSS